VYVKTFDKRKRDGDILPVYAGFSRFYGIFRIFLVCV